VVLGLRGDAREVSFFGAFADQVRPAGVEVVLLEVAAGEARLDVDVLTADPAEDSRRLVDEVLLSAHGHDDGVAQALARAPFGPFLWVLRRSYSIKPCWSA
jgi:hypothetical protein